MTGMSYTMSLLSPIQSLQNPLVKRCLKLRASRHRVSEGKTLIDGQREVRRAFAAGVSVEHVFFAQQAVACDDLPRRERPFAAGDGEHGREGSTQALADLLRDLESAGAVLHPCGGRVFEKVCYGQRTELVAVAKSPRVQLADLALAWSSPGPAFPAGPAPLIAVLDGVEKPGNIGAVLRSADGAGMDAVVLVDGGTDLYNPNAIRASLGTIFAKPVVAASFAEFAQWLSEHPLNLLLARVDGAVPYTDADFRPPTAIVLGSETRGLNRRWSDLSLGRADLVSSGPKWPLGVQSVSVPMHGIADSLNLSVTAAILFYEAIRQRGPR